MDKPTCGTCPYWDENPAVSVYWAACCRNPPTIEGDERRGISLETHRENWCGEHPDFPEWIAEQRKPVDSVRERPQMTLAELRRLRDKPLEDWMDCNGIPRKDAARSLMRVIADLYDEGLSLEQMMGHRRVRQKKAYIHCAGEYLEKWANRTQDVAGYTRRAGS